MRCLTPPCTPCSGGGGGDGGGGLVGALRARELLGGRQPRVPDGRGGCHDALCEWAESNVIQSCEASYCQLLPHPRSTIATAFRPDGQLLASTQCVPPYF